jgi:hypothetical protein
MAVGGGLVATWNGIRWSAKSFPTARHGGGPPMRAIDCVSATACVAVGDAVVGGQAVLFQFNGHAWLGRGLGKRLAGIDWTDVSCSLRDGCVVLGSGSEFGDSGSPIAFVWSESRRPTVQRWPEDRSVDAVSCTRRATCVAVGSVIATIQLR